MDEHAAFGDSTPRAQPRRIALIELFERDGRVARAVDVLAWPLSLGRALDNDVVIDDPWLAPQHALLRANADGSVVLQVLASRNGVLGPDGKRIAGGNSVTLPAGGGTLHLGGTRLRLRLPDEVLAPEKPLPGLAPGQRLHPALMALALLLIVVLGHWVSLDPGADYSAWLPMLMGLPLVLAAWCGGWALMSKLFQHRFDFSGHLRIALPWMLAMSLVDTLLPQIAASLAIPWLWHCTEPLQALLGAFMLRQHLVHVLPLHIRTVTASVAVLAVGGGALSMALTYRSTDSLRAAPYMSTLPLPALRVAGTVPTSTLVQDMAPLAAKIAERVGKAKKDDEEAELDAPGD